MCGLNREPLGGVNMDRFGSRLLEEDLDEDEGMDLGAELLEDELLEWPTIVFAHGGTIEFSIADDAGCFSGLEFIGDVGRDPIGDRFND